MINFLIAFFKSLQILTTLKKIIEYIISFFKQLFVMNTVLKSVKVFVINLLQYLKKINPLTVGYTIVVLLVSLLGISILKNSFANFFDHKQFTVKFENINSQDYYASIPGTIVWINPNFSLGKFISPNTFLYQLDETAIDQQINDLQKQFPELVGNKSIVEQQIITPANKIDLLRYQSEMKDALEDITYYESLEFNLKKDYGNLLQFYNEGIITQNELDKAQSLLENAIRKKNQAKNKYELNHSLLKELQKIQSKKQIIITTTGDSTQSDNILNNTSSINKQLELLQEQKLKLQTKSTEKGYLCNIYVKKGDIIKSNQKIYSLCNQKYLNATINLDEKIINDVRLAKYNLYLKNKDNVIIPVDNIEFNKNKIILNVLATKVNTTDKYIVIMEKRK